MLLVHHDQAQAAEATPSSNRRVRADQRCRASRPASALRGTAPLGGAQRTSERPDARSGHRWREHGAEAADVLLGQDLGGAIQRALAATSPPPGSSAIKGHDRLPEPTSLRREAVHGAALPAGRRRSPAARFCAPVREGKDPSHFRRTASSTRQGASRVCALTPCRRSASAGWSRRDLLEGPACDGRGCAAPGSGAGPSREEGNAPAGANLAGAATGSLRRRSTSAGACTSGSVASSVGSESARQRRRARPRAEVARCGGKTGTTRPVWTPSASPGSGAS